MTTTISFIFILIFTFTATAQTGKSKAKPDFSGTWILDKTKTKKIDFDWTLILEHREPQMKITSNLVSKGVKKTEERILYTDGRTVSNVRVGSELASQEFSWAGKSLIRESLMRRSAENLYGRINEGTSEKWELSKDGKTLTITKREMFVVNTPNQNRSFEQSPYSLTQGETIKEFKFKRSGE